MTSKEIKQLEDSLNARLLHRSTRNVQLTDAGVEYLQRVREILEKLDNADNLVQNLQQHPRGKLKINVPMALGITHLSTLFTDFMLAYPDIELDIHLGDESVDLVEQDLDIGFRASSLPIEEGVAVQGSLKVNSTLFMMEAIKRGQGIGFTPGFVCRDAIKKGEVIEILHDSKKPKLTLYALYPTRHFVPSKLTQCIAFLEQ